MIFSDDDDSDEAINLDAINLIDIPHLPANHRLPTSGVEIIIRCLRRDEIRIFYDALKAAVLSNDGYGYDELPNFAYFVKYYLNNYSNFVYETTSQPPRSTSSANEDNNHHQIIAFANFGASWFARDSRSRLTDGNLVILPEHRGKRLAVDLINIIFGLSVDMGYSAVYGMTSATNVAFLRSTLAVGYIVTGTVPRGIFFPDQGWVDVVMFYSPPGRIVPFKQQLLQAKTLS